MSNQVVDDSVLVASFIASLQGKDAKTITAYAATVRAFVSWLATMPGGTPFEPTLLTEAAMRGYLDTLKAKGQAPRTRAKAITALQRFCRWAQDEGHIRRNPIAHIERPTIAALAPTELTPEARYVLHSLVERQNSLRLSAIIALAHWSALRISEIATLSMSNCTINQRAGSLRIMDAKGGKTRTIDLHNAARRALYAYLYENAHAPDARDPDSDYVFTGQRAAWLRRQGRPDHLSTRAIEHLWLRTMHSATRDEWLHLEGTTFHDLRHDWAHRARQSGWLLEEIAVYAGHQTKDGAPAIQTTVRYTLPSRQQLRERLQQMD